MQTSAKNKCAFQSANAGISYTTYDSIQLLFIHFRQVQLYAGETDDIEKMKTQIYLSKSAKQPLHGKISST